MLAQEAAPALPVTVRCRRNASFGEHTPNQRRRDVDAELAQLADHPHVAPPCVLACESHNQLARFPLKSRPPRPVRVRPAASDQPPVPAQQRLRPHREHTPRAARRDPAECRQHEPVARLESRPTHLSTENRQLVPQHKNFELLRPIAPGEQHQQR
jgi:hypothetical protein